MHHFSTLPLLGLLLSLVSLSWAQSNSSSPSLTGSISLSSTSSLNTSSTSSASLTSSAQFPALSGYSPCVTNCLAVGVARVNCSSITDINCYCVNSNFTQEVFTCIVSACPNDLMTEEKLAQQFCNLASSSPTLTFPTTTISNSSSSSSSSNPSSISSLPQSTPSPTSTTSSGIKLNSGTVSLFKGFLAILVYMLSVYLI